MQGGRRWVVGGMLAVALVASAALAFAAKHHAGRLDLEFGSQGVRTVRLTASYDEVQDAAVGRRGRVILAGFSGDFDSMAVVVLKPNGKLDHGFSRDGVKEFKFVSGEQAAAESVAVDRKGRILVMGDRGAFSGDTPGNHHWSFAVARIKPGGAFDRSFGHRGRRLVSFPGHDAYLGSGALAPDGKIVLVGRREASRERAAVVVLNRNGNIDRQFSKDGRKDFVFGPTHTPSGDSLAESVAVDRKGKLVVGGLRTGGGSGGRVGLARLTPNGAFDHRFSKDGRTTIGAPLRHAYLTSLFVDHARRISMSIAGSRNQENGAAIERLKSNGGFDHKFSHDGRALLRLGHPFAVGEITRDRRGRLVGSGCSPGSSGNYRFAAFRLHPGGSVDRRFGTHGLKQIKVGSHGSCAGAVAVDHKQRILLAGDANRPGPDTDFAVARLKP